MRRLVFVIAATALAACANNPVATPANATAKSAKASASTAAIPEIPFTSFVLSNGLRVVVHEDRKAPIVAVNIWYHVGSKDEQPGKTGFAHLFEHLMFNGSENYNGEFFEPLENVGATSLNGTTNVDRTNYFATVPTPSLDLLLWLESDRMGNLLGAIDQAKLDEQRDVVKNEKRQGEGQPYGRVFSTVVENTYPAGHPYSWPTIGSMEDLDAASLEDVKTWFKTHYGPNNAVIVLAGDIDAETARDKVEQYFGHIPPGPTLTKQDEWVAKMTGTHRQVMQDRVPQARIYKVWNIPGYRSADRTELSLAAERLGGGKNSLLHKRLVFDEQLATNVSAIMWRKELGSQLFVIATVAPGVEPAVVDRAIDEEIAAFLDQGPTQDDLDQIRTGLLANFIRSAEGIGGFGGKSDILARSTIYGGAPDAYLTNLQDLMAATPTQVRDAARRWLSDGQYVLTVVPFDQTLTAQGEDVPRDSLPAGGTPPDLRLPAIETANLSNGLKVVLAQRTAAPLVEMGLIADAGYAADLGTAPGTASMTMAMLDEGTTSRDALEISAEMERLGAQISASASLDVSQVSLSAIKPNLKASVALWADLIRNPTFPQSELDKLRKRWLANIAQEKARPVSLGIRVLPPLLYGDGHAYGQPLTGSGTERSIAALQRDDLVAHYNTWMRPDNATLLIVGDTTLAEITPMLEAELGGWRAPEASKPVKQLDTVAQPSSPRVFLLDRPDTPQAIILAGHVIPGIKQVNNPAVELVNTVLGGSFTSRINMNLREDKGWSYGARSLVLDTNAQRPFLVYAPVQTDKTGDSIAEIKQELAGFLGGNPPSEAEISKAKNNLTLSLPGDNETNSDVAGTLADSIVHGLPFDYYERYVSVVRGLDDAALRQAAQQLVTPDALTWVIVGDLAKIEDQVRAQNLGTIVRLDEDGKPMTEQ